MNQVTFATFKTFITLLTLRVLCLGFVSNLNSGRPLILLYQNRHVGKSQHVSSRTCPGLSGIVLVRSFLGKILLSKLPFTSYLRILKKSKIIRKLGTRIALYKVYEITQILT